MFQRRDFLHDSVAHARICSNHRGHEPLCPAWLVAMVAEVADEHGRLQKSNCEASSEPCFSPLSTTLSSRLTAGLQRVVDTPPFSTLGTKCDLQNPFPRIQLAWSSWGPHRVPSLSNWTTLPGVPVLARAIRRVPQGESHPHPSLLSLGPVLLGPISCPGRNRTHST